MFIFSWCAFIWREMMTCPWNKMSTFIYVSLKGMKSAVHLLPSSSLMELSLSWIAGEQVESLDEIHEHLSYLSPLIISDAP